MKIREEIMLFILKEYNHWKTQSLEIYDCIKNMTIGKKKKINKGLNIKERESFLNKYIYIYIYLIERE